VVFDAEYQLNHGSCQVILLITAYIMINVAVGKVAHVVEKLKSIENIKWVSVVAGEFDIIVRVHVESLEELFYVTEKIHRIEGITRTTTHVVEKEISSE